MTLEFSESGWEDLCYWIDEDQSKIKKIKELITSIKQSPFKGLGKPESLKYEFKGCWSRRITREHRLVYSLEGKRGKNQRCIIHQCRFHYEK